MNNLSAIIYAHNEEDYLEKTIKNFKETEFPHELIVVCDSCTDKTSEIAKDYTSRVFEVNFKNISKTRNFGAKKAKGNILVFSDADTIFSNNYLEEISESMKNYDYGCAKWKSETKKFLGKYLAWNSNRYHKKKKTVGGNSFVKKNFFDKVNGFDENMKKGEDTDFGDRLREIDARHIFLEKAFQFPSERRYKKEGYLKLIYRSWEEVFLYKYFRKKYDRVVAS
jgi:glycosyltransferase involved in cell wall biosynthesis